MSGIYFYEDDVLWNSINSTALRNKVESVDAERMNQLNIMFTEGTLSTASGFTSLPSISDYDMYIVLLRVYSQNSDWVGGAQTLTHEMGHCLDLWHTYYGGGATAICDPLHHNYLWDVMGDPSLGYSIPCPFPRQWIDPWSNNTDYVTNNFMSGSPSLTYVSPLQIGQMWRTLYLKSIRQYTENSYDPNNPWIVNQDETWDFYFKLYQDLVVLLYEVKKSIENILQI